MLELRHLSVLSIPIEDKKFSAKQLEVLKNVKEEIKHKLNTASDYLKSSMKDYDEIRKEYHCRLMRKDQASSVSMYSMQLSRDYNRLMDARNICASTKLWSENFVTMDHYIMSVFAAPVPSTFYEELDKILRGVMQCMDEIHFPEELTPMESELYGLILDFENMCKEIHKELHKNDEKYSLLGFSHKLQSAVSDENKARSDYLEIAMAYDHTEALLSTGEPDDDILMKIFTLLGALPLQ